MKMFMATPVLLMTFAFAAEARVAVRYAEDYTCSQVQAVVQTHGEALVYSHAKYDAVDLYDVAYAGLCPDVGASDSAPFFVDTADQANCHVGTRCVPTVSKE